MSVSTDALLVYGYEITDEVIDAVYARNEVDFDEWVTSVTWPGGISIVTHCSVASPMYIIAAGKFEAHRGYPFELRDVPSLASLAAHPDVRQALDGAYRLTGDEPPAEGPQWLLCSHTDYWS